ncbi:MAG: plasmid partitioning protein ParA [Candidatus Saccharibacteria bacterium]|nr:plasmid partitioning protein ParA [Candidatus Saccharibacteria bacterium]
MGKEQVYAPAGPPVGTVEVHQRPAAPDRDPHVGVSPSGQPNDTSASQVQTPEDTVAPLEERPVPLSGGRAVWYEVMKTITFNPNRPWPKLNKEEQRILQEQRDEEQRRIQAKIDKENRVIRNAQRFIALRVLSDEKPSATVAFWGLKGDSATTTTCAISADVMSEVTCADVSAVDLNPASGTLGERLGKSNVEVGVNNTVTIRELLYIGPRIKNRKHFAHYARPTENGVFVVSADNIVDRTSHLNSDDAASILKIAEDNSSYPYIDTPNDITTPVSQEIASKAGVYVFTAFTGEPDSLRQLSKTMETLRRHGHQDKVDNGVVVISGIQEGENVDDYRRFLHIVNIDNKIVQRLAEFKGHFLGIPFDHAIKPAAKIQLKAIQQDTYYAYVDVNIAILELAPVPNPELPSLKELRNQLEEQKKGAKAPDQSAPVDAH